MKYLIVLLMPLWLLSQEKVIIEVPGMHCPLCTTAVKKALQKVEGVEKVSVLLQSKEATLVAREGILEKVFLDAVLTTGYVGVIKSRQQSKD